MLSLQRDDTTPPLDAIRDDFSETRHHRSLTSTLVSLSLSISLQPYSSADMYIFRFIQKWLRERIVHTILTTHLTHRTCARSFPPSVPPAGCCSPRTNRSVETSRRWYWWWLQRLCFVSRTPAGSLTRFGGEGGGRGARRKACAHWSTRKNRNNAKNE